jgi:hypothetical protein
MKKIFFLSVFLTFGLTAFSQVTVILAPPPPTELSLNNLFKIQVINNSQKTFQAVIEGNLSVGSSQLVYDVHYRQVEVKPGVNLFSFNNLQVERENYGSNEQTQKLRSTGLVPYGYYILCATLLDPLTNDQIAFNCVEQNFGPNTPPQLLSPSNEEEITTQNPLLVWIPPSPVQANETVLYDLKLVEILNNESPYDAIVRNPLLLFQKDIPSTSLLYAPGDYPLETGKTYAWQVMAKSGGSSLGETEVWSFKVVKTDSRPTPETPESGSYYKLKKTLDGGYAIAGEKLRFAYDNKYDSAALKYRITDLYGKEFTPKDIQPMRKSGDNRYELPLKKMKLKTGQYYMLEVFSSKNERQVMLFKYDKSFAKN